MAQVFSFQSAAAKKQEEQQLVAMKKHLLEIIAEMSDAEKMELLDAIERNDQDKYFALTQPIILRHAIREFNK